MGQLGLMSWIFIFWKTDVLQNRENIHFSKKDFLPKVIFIKQSGLYWTRCISTINKRYFKDRPPALSFKIAGDFFENNLSDETDSYTFNADTNFYERTVAASDLDLSFDSQSDGELLL